MLYPAECLRFASRKALFIKDHRKIEKYVVAEWILKAKQGADSVEDIPCSCLVILMLGVLMLT